VLEMVRGTENVYQADRFARNVLPIIAPLKADGLPLRKIADVLNHPPPKGATR
jgi:hypothetical protein